MERHTRGRDDFTTWKTTTAQGRNPTEAESQARRRRGIHGHQGVPQLVWAPVRNGYPVRFYVYRGEG